MTRVWLDAGEWECCGDPFAVGDQVQFVIGRRSLPPAFVRELGEELASTIDAVETRHPEIPTDDRVRGRVTGVHVVTQENLHRFDLRRPGHGAPPDAEMPAEGESWPFSGRDVGNGLVLGSRPTRWMVTIEPVPGAVALTPVDAVPGERPPSAAPPFDEELDGPEPAERRVRGHTGWVVDVDEGASLRMA